MGAVADLSKVTLRAGMKVTVRVRGALCMEEVSRMYGGQEETARTQISAQGTVGSDETAALVWSI